MILYVSCTLVGLLAGAATVQLCSKVTHEKRLKAVQDYREKTRLETDVLVIYADRFADGTIIACEGPCTTPDGREAYVEAFSETPMAVIKYENDDDREDEHFDARTCYPHAAR